MWRLDVRPALESTGVPFREGSAWQAARAALAGKLPLQWRQTPPALDRPEPPPATLLDQLGEHWPSVLDGPSFGLPFLLAMASDVLDEALPPDLAATACVARDGQLRPVAGLWDKLHMIVQRAPGIRRVLVADSQMEEGHRLRDGLGQQAERVQLVGCGSVSEAVQQAFPDAAAAWIQRGADPERRRGGRTALFGLALSERDHALDWAAVERAAGVAIEHWTDLMDDERAQLEICRAVAGRHRGQGRSLGTPRAVFFDDLPQPQRLDCLSQLIQHAADTGTPDPAAMLTLAERFAVRGQDAFPAHLRLMGAMGRLLATMARPEDALRVAEEVVDGWLRRGLRGVSYPLAECYRLAGGLEDHPAFDRTTARHLASLPHLQLSDAMYVDIERGCALARLGDHALAGPLLATALADAKPLHVRLKARRFAEDGSAPLTVHDGSPELAARAAALCELDRALGQRDSAAAEHATHALESLDPDLTGAMRRFAEARSFAPAGNWPTYLQRFYPY